MAMPEILAFGRHGESEPNFVQHGEKRGEFVEGADLVYDRHDSDQRLTPTGERQAVTAGEWLRNNFIAPEDFDARFVSPYIRPMETAVHLGGVACSWITAKALVERDWGHYGSTPREERLEKFKETERQKGLSSFYTRFDGGESVFDCTFRVRDFIDTLHRDKHKPKTVLAVTHGELMWGARFEIERMIPQEWQALDSDESLRIGNCALLIYSRINPTDPEDVRNSLSDGWRLMVNPVEPENSPYGGEWHKLPGKRYFSAAQLLDIVQQYPRLLPQQDENMLTGGNHE